MYNPDGYIPNILLEELLISIKKELGLSSLSHCFGDHFKLTNMGKYSMYLFQTPNLLTLFNENIKYQEHLRTNYKMKLEILGPVSKFSVKIIKAPGLGKLLYEEIDIMRLLDAFKLIDGPKFVPVEIGITSKSIMD